MRRPGRSQTTSLPRRETAHRIRASTIARAGLIAGGRRVRPGVEEHAIVDVHAAIVRRLDVVAREVVTHRTKRGVAVDPQPVFEWQLDERSCGIPDAAATGLRFDLCGA